MFGRWRAGLHARHGWVGLARATYTNSPTHLRATPPLRGAIPGVRRRPDVGNPTASGPSRGAAGPQELGELVAWFHPLIGPRPCPSNQGPSGPFQSGNPGIGNPRMIPLFRHLARRGLLRRWKTFVRTLLATADRHASASCCISPSDPTCCRWQEDFRRPKPCPSNESDPRSTPRSTPARCSTDRPRACTTSRVRGAAPRSDRRRGADHERRSAGARSDRARRHRRWRHRRGRVSCVPRRHASAAKRRRVDHRRDER